MTNTYILIIMILILIIICVIIILTIPKTQITFQEKYKYDLGCILIVKNEALIIDEFFKHYIWQGVDHFYVIDNGSTDCTKDIIARYPTSYYYLVERFQQHKHYNTVFAEMKNECKWLIICDCDEYIYNRERGRTIKDYVLSLNHTQISNITLNWKMFGSSGFETQPKHIRKSFIQRAHNHDINVKQIISTCLTKSVSIHEHQHIIKNPILNPNQLALNHYAIMSKEYFSKVKMTRGDATSPENVRNWDYFNRYDHKQVIDTELKDLLD